MAVARQATYVQQKLQQLLDAQSLGLLSGLGQESQQDISPSSERSSEPSIRTPSRSPPGPIRLSSSPPVSPPSFRQQNTDRSTVSLSTARSSIHRALLQLSELKASESSALDNQQETLLTFLSSLDSLTTKRKGIEQSIKDIEAKHSDQATSRASEDSASEHSSTPVPGSLKDEEARLSSEIHSLETRLYEVKARLSHIRRLRQERENRLAARLSSWRGALADVEKSIHRNVLEGRGLEGLYPFLRHSGRTKREGQGVWSLPRERRTVELVKEEVEGKAEEVAKRKQSVEREEKACVEGAHAWKGVLGKVKAVEQMMGKEMRGLGNRTSSKEKEPSDRPDAAREGMQGVIELMTQTIGELDEELVKAERNGWNPLVCAIGAEAEALKQGKNMLIDALGGAGALSGSSRDPESSMMTARSRFSDQNHNAQQSLESSIQVQKDSAFQQPGSQDLVDFAAAEQGDNTGAESEVERQSFSQPAGEHQDTEDEDEPGPEFLIEQSREG